MEDTIQINERPLTGARIRGIPAYRLTGVNDANRDLVKSTEMWVHHPYLGDEGWYLAVPDAWHDAAARGLGEHGLGLEYLGRLPKRSNVLFYTGLVSGVVAAYVLGMVIANVDGGNAGVAGFIGIVTIIIAAALLNHRTKSAAQYGTLLALTGGGHGGASYSTGSGAVDMPRHIGSLSGTGTTEHLLYAD